MSKSLDAKLDRTAAASSPSRLLFGRNSQFASSATKSATSTTTGARQAGHMPQIPFELLSTESKKIDALRVGRRPAGDFRVPRVQPAGKMPATSKVGRSAAINATSSCFAVCLPAAASA